eukprot:9393096-Pyramimonas_sp.AAC.1
MCVHTRGIHWAAAVHTRGIQRGADNVHTRGIRSGSRCAHAGQQMCTLGAYARRVYARAAGGVRTRGIRGAADVHTRGSR